MSNLLWKLYHDGEVEKFRQLLTNGFPSQQHTPRLHGGGPHSLGAVAHSPGTLGSSPKTGTKTRKVSGPFAGPKASSTVLTRADINNRDYAGLTILHRAVSSTSADAIGFATALIEHPAIDLYVQDTENGWTALHRALYFGNITLARAIMEKDSKDPSSQAGGASQRVVTSVIKVKDLEGNSPFDVYNATIARRTIKHGRGTKNSGDDTSDSDTESTESGVDRSLTSTQGVDGEEVYIWGSNRNHGLGFKDGDDRQHPEKVTLKRPDHLLFRFYREHLESTKTMAMPSSQRQSLFSPRSVSELPTLITNRPIIIQDVALSKLHSAILTTDPESNLFMCGFGPGGRLGTGDEATRFSYTCIDEGSLAGKKVTSVALGQSHSLVLTSEGEVTSFGTNTFGQLGYSLPRPALKDEEPICSTPRQIFGPLKRERVIGIAASAIHSVAHTSTSLFTWGKNEGQLGLMDSDSRSLEVQMAPRKVAASLFKSHISLVSAINVATIVLLANHTVCVFTNYGYNIVKFPLHEGFTNYHLKSDALTTRYDAMSNHISYITAGGDTIAAVSTRGDLFTLNVCKIDTSPSTSTTNPSKIRDSLSTPEKVWSLRKGNWDGIRSAAVTENGSVIVCTHAGAVWRRIKRAKNKDAFVGTGYSRKDFKFQRIPGLTKVVAVRSTTFGVYAAIRKDCDVTKTQIVVEDQNLWSDVAPLFCLRGLKTSPPQGDDRETPRCWQPSFAKDVFEPLKKAALNSSDLEADVSRYLVGFNSDGCDFELCNSSSDIRIPAHSFILGRSPTLRKAIADYRQTGSYELSEILLIQSSTSKKQEAGTSIFGASSEAAFKPKSGTAEILFIGLDFFTVFNLMLYLYTDTIADVWHFTRQAPEMAYRYRQVRVELMKLSNQLRLFQLESAARLMTEPEPQMNLDLRDAIQDSSFFDSGDTIVELDGSEVALHSSFICQRCPFFQGLFNGRAGGRWLAGRWETGSGVVRIDLKHISTEAFTIVLLYLYTDAGTEIFNEVVSTDIDDFSVLVMEVMAASNELMLDRLSQICQEVIGRFVNTRNICHMLNEIAPCSVTEFKDSALEYLCLQLECMLENHLLDDLDDELLLELDAVVRANQLNCLPFAKSGRADSLLHDKYPDLAKENYEERQRRVRDMIFRTNMNTEDPRLSSSSKGRIASVDDFSSISPSQDKGRRKPKTPRNAPFSPSVRPKDTPSDLMFDMEDDPGFHIGSPKASATMQPVLFPNLASSPKLGKPAWDVAEPNSVPVCEVASNLPQFSKSIVDEIPDAPMQGTKGWHSNNLQSTKLDMREIMLQASSSRTSALSMSISAQKTKIGMSSPALNVNKSTAPKLSQKERKKQQQLAAQHSQRKVTSDSVSGSSSPWHIAATGPRTSLKEVLAEPISSSLNTPPNSLECSAQKQQSMQRRTASPDTRFAGQRRTVNTHLVKPHIASSPRSTPLLKSISPIPHSKSYTTPTSKAEPSLQLSMADIIVQQRREQEVIKEAVAKRSLQEIQEEQAFQEWWDQESKRAQEEELVRSQPSPSNTAKGGNRGKPGRGRGRGKGDGFNRGRGRDLEKASTVDQGC